MRALDRPRGGRPRPLAGGTLARGTSSTEARTPPRRRPEFRPVYRDAPADLETPRSCHQILGVPRGASEEALRLAFLNAAFACHPENPLVQGDLAAARKRLREAVGAWAVLAGRPILGGGGEADMQAMRAFDEALAVHALELARSGLDANAILNELSGGGCPPTVGWPAAERAAAQAALLRRKRPNAREAVPSQGAASSRAAAARAGAWPSAARPSPSSSHAGLHAGVHRAAGARGSAGQTDTLPVADGPLGLAMRLSNASRVLRGLPIEQADPHAADLQAGVEPDHDDDAPPPPDASFAQRVAATVVDVLLVFVVCAAPVMMLGRGLDASPVAVERITLAAMLVGGALYSICSELGWGGSPGKRLLGMRVETLRGRAPDRQTVLLRHGLRTMSWCLFGLGFLIAPFNERRQALHDLLTETRVLAVGPPRHELVQALCAAPVAVAALAFALTRVGG
jgi:uncharacterized RDD family membrane protein YckC